MTPITEILKKNPTEIANFLGIAEDKVLWPEPKPVGESSYVELPEMGMSIVLDTNSKAECIQLYALGSSDGYKEYKGTIIHNISFASSKNETRNILGTPAQWDDGGKGRGLFGGFMKPWDAFILDEYRYHFEYSEDASSINLVSISLN